MRRRLRPARHARHPAPVSAVEIAIFASAALVAGIVDAIAGGGGLITLPTLLAAGLPPHVALATNKGSSVFGSGAALATYWRHGQVDTTLAARTFPLGLAGSFLGAMAVLAISPAALRPVVIGLLVGAAVLLIVKKPLHIRAEPPPGRVLRACLLAAAVGAYDGFFGPGTGTFLIVGFVVLCGSGLAAATADAKVVNLASNLAALALFAHGGHVLWQVALPMGVAQIIGGTLGARLAMRGGARLIRAAVLVVSGSLVAKLAYDVWRA
jgi:uncharacterized protein